MNCKSCGGALKAGAKFCSQCGAVAPSTAEAGRVGQTIRCPQCGAINRPGAKFCRQDGAPLVDAPALSQEPREVPPVAERVASPAVPIVTPVSHEPPPAEPAPPLRPVHADTTEAPGGGGTSSLWLAVGALAVLAAIGGGYWFYKGKGASPQVAETTQAPDSQTPGTAAAPEPEGDVLEVPPPAAKSGTPLPTQSQVADEPSVQTGDRWVTEVVDHQDPMLNYRAERTVTDVGPGRIFTAVRTLGKDYVRVVEYTDEWALVATHLRSGATTSYSPTLPYLSFPLQPGKSWNARVVETDSEGKQRVHEVRARVESWETVQVPAGTFSALKVVLTDDISKDGVVVQQGQDVSWYAPEARRTVKTEETSLDPATGERRRRTISLIEYSLGSGRSVAQSAAAAEAPAAANLAPFDSMTVPQLAANAQAMAAAYSLFQNNCARCHGADGGGAQGFPNLTNSDWQWGRSPDTIVQTIANGRTAAMTPWGEVLGAEGVDQVVAYVRKLSGQQTDLAKAAAGAIHFQTFCVACHGPGGKGMMTVGAPNLTDDVWLYGGDEASLKETVTHGRMGQMPAFKDQLGEQDVRLLAAYVLKLSGGAQ